MYKPNSLDQERSSWRTVIYFNVVHSIKHILSTLEAWDDSLEDDMDIDESASMSMYKSRMAGPSSEQPTASTSSAAQVSDPLNGMSLTPPRTGSPHHASSRATIANLRRRLSPLTSTDTALADRLSGGITVSGSGKGSVFVRSGWQARTIENALGRKRPSRGSAEGKKGRDSVSSDVVQDQLVQDVGSMLDASKEDIRELWAHSTVKGLMAKRRLKLDEWSELCVMCSRSLDASLSVPQLSESHYSSGCF